MTSDRSRLVKPARLRGPTFRVPMGSVAGFFSWQKIRPPRGIRTLEEMVRQGIDPERYVVEGHRSPKRNLIVDSGIDFWIENTQSATAFLSLSTQTTSNRYNVRVGTGNTPPTPSDTTLENQAHTNGDKADVSSNPFAPVRADNLPLWAQVTRTFEFPAGIATATLAEVGLFIGISGAMLARDLFRDANGNPVTIAKGEDEILRVQHTARYYFPVPFFREIDLLAQDVHGETEDLKFFTFPAGGLNLGVETFFPDRWGSGSAGQQMRVARSDFYDGDPVEADAFRTASGSATNTQVSGTAEDYTPGSGVRRVLFEWSPASFEGQIFGFYNGSANINAAGVAFWLAEADRPKLVKTTDDRLRIVVDFFISRHVPEESPSP